MKALIATRSRRITIALMVWLIAIPLMATLMAHVEQPDPAHLEIGDWMKRFVAVPGLLALMIFLFTTAMTRPAQAVTPPDQATRSAAHTEEPAKPFVAQVVGMIWLNPLQRMDYPTEWQLLWAQGLATPNKNDDMVRTDPESFSTLKSIGALVYGNEGKETFKGFYAKYIDKSILLLRTRYGTNSKYFYTVKPEDQKYWRELAGIRVEIAIPSRLDATFARSRLVDRMMTFYEIGPPSPKTLWSRDTPPDVQITQGGANAGFTSLNNALDYLQANPDKSVWVMNWDAPNFPPTDAQINENLVVLFLAGPTFNTEREPLAWIGKAATGNAEAFS